MGTGAFEAKSGKELAKLAEQSRASIAGERGGLCQENQIVSQVGESKVSTTRILNIMLNFV